MNRFHWMLIAAIAATLWYHRNKARKAQEPDA